jgi:hypothetical protein
MQTPVALLIFKRPDTTEKILEILRQVKPSKLFIFADGPRADFPEDIEKCKKARSIIDRIDWDCEVLKNFSDTNLGCGLGVFTGINWVFENVEEAIILEDDCLPHPTFFEFCDELLTRYRHDERVMMVSGFNILGEWKSNIQDYHFSYYGAIWGWASWRRAWKYYDFDAKIWSNPEARERVKDLLSDDLVYHYRSKTFDQIYKQRNINDIGLDTWDYQWDLTLLIQSGLTITPSINLISNIGFSDDATHTKSDIRGIANSPVASISFPLREPNCVVVEREYDLLRLRKRYGTPSKSFILKFTFKQLKQLILKNWTYGNRK